MELPFPLSLTHFSGGKNITESFDPDALVRLLNTLGNRPTYSTLTASDTVEQEDELETFLVDTSGGAVAVTLPVDIEVGTSVRFILVDASNAATFVGDGTSTVSSFGGLTAMAGLNAVVTAECTSADSWLLIGQLA